MEINEALSNEDNKDTTPNDDIVIPVKYNKQIMNLDIETAGNLAQKGLKFESIYKDYELLKQLALAEGKSVSQYVNSLAENSFNTKKEMLTQKCGGDSQLAEHILKLEAGKGEILQGFDELKEKFPEIKDIDCLPESVLENANLRGSLLLDEYLRYRLEQELAVKNSRLQQAHAKNSSTGSQQSKKGNYNPETTEFLRGLWNK